MGSVKSTSARLFPLILCIHFDPPPSFYPVYPTSSSLAARWVLSIVTLLGFVVLDFAYIGVVINYSIQCQLLVYLIHNVCNRMRTKEWEIEQTIKVGDVILCHQSG